jgi:hypothetical protein
MWHEKDSTGQFLALEMGGAMSQDMWTTCRSWKKQGHEFFFELIKGMQPCQHPDFKPMRLVSEI